jgi:hypothetical protein
MEIPSPQTEAEVDPTQITETQTSQTLLVSYNNRRPDHPDMIGGCHNEVHGSLVLLSFDIKFSKLCSVGKQHGSLDK